MSKIKVRVNQLDEDDFPTNWHPLVRKIYARRIASTDEVNKSLKYLLPPTGLPDITKAADRIWQAIESQEMILIYGDYDVDGATSTALLYRALSALGAKVMYFIPNRWRHGYGLSVKGLEAVSQPYDLVVTVDNGIRSNEAAEYLKEQQTDLIITDHHEPDVKLPTAYAIVNPKRKDSTFGSKNLAGVGVAFYLLLTMRQVAEHSDKPFPINLTQYLDLVALGTTADIVPLDRNNRILVQQGLLLLKNRRSNFGIKALCEVANVDVKQIKSQDFSFAIAPRLNAVGRLEDMSEGVALLVTDNWATAQDYAALLDAYNRDRKAIENRILLEAERNIKHELPIICAYQADWHEGVIGIIASKLKSKYKKPVMIATDTADASKIKASLRSVKGIDIHELLSLSAKKLPADCLQFGGHMMAAGLSIDKKYYKDLLQALYDSYEELQSESKKDMTIYCDGRLPTDLFNVQWTKYLEYLEPWGAEFPAPNFHNQFIIQECRKLGAQHSKLVLREPLTGQLLQGVWFFNQCDFAYGTKIDAVYQLEINRFYGDERLQLLIQDICLVSTA